MNLFALVDGKLYPLDMRGELDDNGAFKNFTECIQFLLSLPSLLTAQLVDKSHMILSNVYSVLAYSFQHHLTCYYCFRWDNIKFPLPEEL